MNKRKLFSCFGSYYVWSLYVDSEPKRKIFQVFNIQKMELTMGDSVGKHYDKYSRKYTNNLTKIYSRQSHKSLK